MNMSIDPRWLRCLKATQNCLRKVSQKVGAWRRSLTYQTENLFPFSFGMFPQVLQGLFRKSRGPSLRVTHLPLAKEVKQHALCPERNSRARRRRSGEFETCRSTADGIPWMHLASRLSSQSRICLVVAMATGPEGEGTATWWSLQQRAHRLADYFWPFIWRALLIWSKMSRHVLLFNSSCCGTRIALKECAVARNAREHVT